MTALLTAACALQETVDQEQFAVGSGELVAGDAYGPFEVVAIELTGAEPGDYTFEATSATSDSVTVLRDGAALYQIPYVWTATISNTDPALYYTFDFPDLFRITIRHANPGTRNLYGIDSWIFDGATALRVSGLLTEGQAIGSIAVVAIDLTGAAPGDYTFEAATATSNSVTVRRDGAVIHQLPYDMSATISDTNPMQFYTFNFPDLFRITIRHANPGTRNLYGLNSSIFDGATVLRVEELLTEGHAAGGFAVADITSLGAPAGDYTLHVNGPISDQVTLRQGDAVLATASYNWLTTISGTDPALFHTFTFPGYVAVTVRKDGLGTRNLYAIDGLFDGTRPVRISPPRPSFCGDATVDASLGEECDDAGGSAACDRDCTFAECGDHLVNTMAGEVCDDGNPHTVCELACDLSIAEDRTYGGIAIEAITPLGAPVGDYTLYVDGPISDRVTLRRNGTTVGTAFYDFLTTISGTDPAMFYTFTFHGHVAITIRHANPGTRNLYGINSVFDGVRVLRISGQTGLFCGDGTITPALGEVCDDAGESATCDADCTFAQCGDGDVNPTAGESCDDGAETATCDTDCTPAVCGDGVVNALAGEACEPSLTAECGTDCQMIVTTVDYSTQIQPLWNTYCTGCHHSFSYSNMLSRVTPGDPANSKVWKRLNSQNNPMPPSSRGALRPTTDELTLIRTWIEEGALP